MYFQIGCLPHPLGSLLVPSSDPIRSEVRFSLTSHYKLYILINTLYVYRLYCCLEVKALDLHVDGPGLIFT